MEVNSLVFSHLSREHSITSFSLIKLLLPLTLKIKMKKTKVETCTTCKIKIPEGKVAWFKAKPYCQKHFKEKYDERKYSASVPYWSKTFKEKKIEEVKKVKEHINWVKRYDELLISFKRAEKVISSKTIEQYNILVEAFTLLRKQFPHTANYQKLADDLEVSITTVKRLVSLKNCTDWTWKQINNNIISPNKVAIITFEKGIKHQEEIVKWAIETKATNLEIHNYRTEEPKSLKETVIDIKSFNSRITLLNSSLQSYNFEVLTKRNRESVKAHLIKLNESVKKTLEKLE